MGWKSTYLFLGVYLLLGWQLSAQISCQYTLEMYDSFGDGWNGSSLTIDVNGEATSYTVNFDDNNGDFLIVGFTLAEGDIVTLSYLPGTFENEVSYFIYDADGQLVFNDGPFPAVGDEVFSFTASCPSCPAPPSGSVSIDDIRAFYTDISYIPSDPDGEYLVEFGAAGFTPGDGDTITATGATARIEPLAENTAYEFYLQAACSNGDSSIVLGPYAFTTLWAVDVGIVNISSPTTACGLSNSEMVSVTLANFGGLPQQLIPFNFSVNGIPAGVGQPQDGFFTGVIATDSIFETEFDLLFDFSEQGEYIIQAWTELEGDSVITNDTFTVVVTNIPVIAELPYFIDFEEWNGGWSVGEESASPSWAYGTPSGAVINSAASGDFAWVTNLSGDYNVSEFSYLVSPCFDFSSLAEDPLLSFSLFYDSESCCDEGWVEVSTDAGATWTKVGAAGTGLNWYNDTFNQWWDGTGGFDGWVNASNALTGTAGSSDVVVRFVFSSNFSVQREGMGIDDILIAPQLANDVTALSANHTALEGCGSPEDQITMTINNIGLDEQSGFMVGYSVNGGPAVTETLPADFILAQGESGNYTFATTFDSSFPGEYSVTVWTALENDGLVLNDTTTFFFATALSLPFAEDFEGGAVPTDWELDFDLFVANAHNSQTFVLYDNMYSGDTEFNATMPVIGPIAAGDTLYFDYRYTDWSAGEVGAILSAADVLSVLVSTDCGETYELAALISGDNHTPTADFTTVKVGLDAYADQPIKIRFAAEWGSGDYWLDLDNIFIPRCVGTLGLEAAITDASEGGAADGQVIVTPTIGIPPFTFEWADGSTGNTLSDLAPGEYTVSVTDSFGCTDEATYVVDMMVNTAELIDRIGTIQLMPNPTNGFTQLNVQFQEPVAAQVQVLNLLGQPVWQSVLYDQVAELQETIDLSQVPAGIYLVRVQAGNQARTVKVVKTE